LPLEDLEEEIAEGSDGDFDPEAAEDGDDRIGHILGEALVIRYVNSKGEESCRRITLHAAYERGGLHYIRAYCFERAAARTFRSDRIREIIDADTGEIISGVEEILEAVADSADPLDDLEATRRAFKLQKQSIMALLFLARCDGHLHLSEQNVLLTFIDEFCGTKGVDEAYAINRLSRLHPDPISYEKSLRYLARFDPPQLNSILRFAKRLIEADGAITPEEARFAMALQDCRLN
jgi:hypothetical protein